MYQEKPSKLFLKYALPQMIGLLFNSVYLIVDGMFIGNRLGRDSMAAAAVSVPAIEILIAISIAISMGSGVLISSSIGKGKKVEARSLFNLSVLVTLVVSTIIALLGNLFLGEIATLLGSTPAIQKEATTYLWYILTFSPFLLFSFLLSGFARSDNKPRLAMVSLAVGSVSNILLDYIFMYPLNMGIAGAALATALGPIFSVLILLPHFLGKKGTLYFGKSVIQLKTIAKIFALGFPAFIMEFSIGIVTFIYNLAIVRHGLGEMGLASYLIIGYMALIVLTIFLGISQGLQPIISYFNGKKDQQKIKDLLSFSAKSVFTIGLVIYVIIVFFSRHFISWFAPNDLALIEFTYSKSVLYFCGFVFAGLNILVITYWQSVEKTVPALVISLSRSVIALLALIVFLPLIFGINAIWIALSVSEAVTLIFAAMMLWVQKNIRARPKQNELL